MATIIQFTPHIPKVPTPEQVKALLEPEPEEEPQPFNITFVALDERRTAIIGEVERTKAYLDRLPGTYQVRNVIRDALGKNRGSGVILTVVQTLSFIDMMEEDWELNPDVRKVAEQRFNDLIENMKAAK
ncbi:MAG: hypothetical protein IJ767_04035 [Bacteroidaceae bacterium]|nr:hypothetical protein [Bacteroidaceae bacterium]